MKPDLSKNQQFHSNSYSGVISNNNVTAPMQSTSNPYMGKPVSVPLEGKEDMVLNEHNVFGKNRNMANANAELNYVENNDNAKVKTVLIVLLVIVVLVVGSILMVLFG